MQCRDLLTTLQKEAPESLAGVQRFVEVTLRQPVTPSTVGELVLRVHGFLCHAEQHLQHAAPQAVAAAQSSAAAAGGEPHFVLRDALEKLLVSKIYHVIFAVAEGAAERDVAVHARLTALRHLTPAALGVGSPFGEAAIEGWAPAIEQLRRLGQHRAPKDKVMLLVNASRLIERRLNKISRLHARLHAGESRRPIGADEYFPVLVYAVLQANPPQLLSTVTFISRFRSPEALRSLEGCYFTHFRAAVTFLESFEDQSPAHIQRQLKEYAGRASVGSLAETAWHPLVDEAAEEQVEAEEAEREAAEPEAEEEAEAWPRSDEQRAAVVTT